ncbi:tetratricopeptide repeat protein [Leptothoe sp. ISB3NOV94-8A]
MPFPPRFATLLVALTVSTFGAGLTARVIAQPTALAPLLEVTGTLEADDDILGDGFFYDLYEFTGQANQIVTLLLESDAFDTYLTLVDDQGNLVATGNNISSATTNAALVIELPTTGRYRVIASASQTNTQGPYRLTIQPTPADQPNSLLSVAEVTLLAAKAQLQAGLERFKHSDFRAALALWEESLSLYRVDAVRTRFSSDSRQGEAVLLDNLGIAYHSLGEYGQAIDLHQQALDIKQAIGDRNGEANSLGNLGLVYYSLGKYGRAIDLHQQALDIKQAIGDRNGEANSLSNLGLVYDSLGEYGRAIDFYQQALDIDRALGDRQGEAASLGNLGIAYHSLGEYGRAINFHQQQLDIARAIGNRQGEATSLGNLGLVYDSLGEYGRAIDFHQQSLDIARAIGNRQGEATSLGNLGSMYDSLGEYGRAIDFLQQSLDIKRAIGDRQGEATSLGNLGLAHYLLSEYDRAIDFHQQSLDIARAIGDRQGEATSLGNLGLAYYHLGEYGRAIDFHQQQLDIAQAIGDRNSESISLHNLGVAFRNLDNFTAAEQYFQASAHVKESLHDQLADVNRLSLLDSQQSTYRLWQVTLMELNHPKVALIVAERGRAQALAVSMTRSLDRENETFKPPVPLTLERIQAIAVQQHATLVEYSVLPSGRIFIWVIRPDGTIHSTVSDVAALDNSLVDTTGQFAILGQNGSRGGKLPETPLNTLVQDTQTVLTRGGGSSDSPLSRQELDNLLQQLHEVLIEPIAHLLPTDDQQRVIFIPHRELFRVPFTALRDSDGNYLIQHHTILTAPSIQSLELARHHRTRIQSVNTTDALIVGNPHFPDTLTTAYGWQPLAGAEREARNVGTLLSQHLGTSPTVLLHDQATETQVKDQLHSARFIHLATHGNLVSVNEKADLPGVQYSFLPGLLALAASDQDDGSLTADELRDLTRTNPLNAELVVLSACQTGQGRVTSDGVDGLSRTLLTAGVPTMLVSLWNASDHHTVELMDEFYSQFLEEGQDKAQALRQAMLQMIEQGDDNPKHWAAFTLVGEAE